MVYAKNIVFLLGAASMAVVLASCSSSSDSSGSSACAAPAGDYEGFWILNGSNTGNCPDTSYPDPWTDQGLIDVNGNTMTGFPTGGNAASGTICGSTFTTTTSWPEDGGTVTANITANFSSNTAMSGNANWTWTNNAITCNGTTSFTGAKQ